MVKLVLAEYKLLSHRVITNLSTLFVYPHLTLELEVVWVTVLQVCIAFAEVVRPILVIELL